MVSAATQGAGQMAGGAVGTQLANGGVAVNTITGQAQDGNLAGALNTAGVAVGNGVGGTVGNQISAGTQTATNVK